MIRKFPFPPGVRHESTQYAASGYWYDCNNIRFRSSRVESIGGWVRDGTYSLDGIGRASHTSRDYAGNNYQFVGTDWKYYIIAGTNPIDITPVMSTGTVTGTGLFTPPTADVPLISVADAAHGLSVNDWVRFDSVTGSSGVFTEALLEQDRGFQVASVESADSYTIYIWDGTNEVPAPNTTPFCTAFTFAYQVCVGISTQVSGQGYGAGAWGGDNYLPTSFPLNSTPVSSTNGSSVLKFADTSTPVSSGEYVYLQGLTGTVGSATSLGSAAFDLTSMNDHWWRVSAKSTHEFSVDLSDLYGTFSITGDDSGKGGTSGTFYQSVWTDGSESVTGATRGWNDSSTTSLSVGQIRRSYIDSYGEDAMMCNSGGPIYYYDTSLNTSNGIPATPSGTSFVAKSLADFTGSLLPPAEVDSFLVSKKDGHCVALGCSDVGASGINTMMVRWSDQNNPFDWVPSSTNTSGGQVLRSGSRIMGGVSTKDEVVVFTDAAVYSMRFVGPPDTFSFNLITDGVELVGQRAAANAANNVFFMGNDGFYVYGGSVQPLECPVANYVFDDFNYSQKVKTFSAVNSGVSEVSWFYPSSSSFEPDRYVTFNYDERIWYYGLMDMLPLSELNGSRPTIDLLPPTINRTSWRDAIVFGSPMSTYTLEYAPSSGTTPLIERSGVFAQETGSSAGLNAMDSYIESGELDISDGNNFSFISRAIPDLEIFGAKPGSSMASVDLSIKGRDFPGQASSSESTTSIDFSYDTGSSGRNATYTPVGNATSVRARARSIAFRYSATAQDFRWRLGDSRFDLRPDGGR